MRLYVADALHIRRGSEPSRAAMSRSAGLIGRTMQQLKMQLEQRDASTVTVRSDHAQQEKLADASSPFQVACAPLKITRSSISN